MTDDRRILVRPVGSTGGWTSPETSTYDNEAHLQALLVADPGRVPGVSQGAMAVAELPTSGGPIDVCIVDIDGSITVVECKLASNSERRRMVIGQVIDYASAVWMDGHQTFLASWQIRDGPDLAVVLGPEAAEKLKSNVAEARVNLCLAVDSIDTDLRRLVEYLNEVTLEQVQVTALQLEYARHGELEILIPSTFGGEIAAAKTRDATKAPWTRQSFLDALESPEDRELAEWYLAQVEAQSERRGDREPVWYGSRPGGGVHLHPYGLRYAPMGLGVNSAGRLRIFGTWNNWTAIAGHDGFAGLAALLGQHHQVGSRSVQAGSLNRNEIWAEVLRCAIAINDTVSPVGTETGLAH